MLLLLTPLPWKNKLSSPFRLLFLSHITAKYEYSCACNTEHFETKTCSIEQSELRRVHFFQKLFLEWHNQTLLYEYDLQEAVSMLWLPTKQKAWKTGSGISRYIPNSGDTAAAFFLKKGLISTCNRYSASMSIWWGVIWTCCSVWGIMINTAWYTVWSNQLCQEYFCPWRHVFIGWNGVRGPETIENHQI